MDNTGIPMGTFSHQSTITSVNFGSKCTFVGKEAFKKCISLCEINDNNVIETIDSGAFAETNISSLNFSRLVKLQSGAFASCSNLDLVDMPVCPSIPTETFANCINLFSINIPRASKIGSKAFKDCRNLTTVNNDIAPLCEIESNAFYRCNNLKNVNFNNIINIGTRAFEDCKSLDIVKLKICQGIGSSAFKGCENITQVILSNCSVINANAFADCTKLSKVYIYNPLCSDHCILNGEYVFCTHETTSICTINSNITFYFKPDVIEWYKTAQYWSHYADYMVQMVEDNQVIYTTNNNSPIEIDAEFADMIYSNTYNESSNCGIIEFKGAITSLNQIFKGKTSVTSVDISPTCERIEHNAFDGCTSLDSISVSDSLKYIDEYAFKNCKALKSFTIPDSLMHLGEGSFVGCDNIVEFKGNKNFVKYNGKALVSNGALICVLPKDDTETKGRVRNISNIDENINRLTTSCFYGCENMMRIDMPSGLTSIDNNVFENFTNLIEVHFSGNTPPTLGNNVFKNVRSDFKIFVPESGLLEYNNTWKEFGYDTQNIYPKAENNTIIYYSDSKINLKPNTSSSKATQSQITIDGCANGNYFKITDNSLNFLGAYYFSEQNSIKKIILPENTKVLGAEAFADCENLEYIYLSDNITHIDHACFVGCKSLSRIHIPKSPKITFGNAIFSLCENLKEFGTYYEGYVSNDNRCYITNSSTLKFFAQGGVTGEYTIPNKITTIAEFAFQYSNITGISLSQNTKVIGENAFSQCEKLERINNWDNVETISQYAFYKCESLGKISLPSKLKTISQYAFSNCNKMYINNNNLKNVTSIGSYAFSSCTNFKNVDDITGEETPLNFDSITHINEKVFYNCTQLTKVNINDNITEIEKSAFEGCINLTSVSISTESKLNKINSSAFRACGRLKNLHLPKNLTTIGDSAFEECKQFMGNVYEQLPPTGSYNYSLTIPENVTSIGSSCFKNTNVFFLNLSSGLKTISDSAFYGTPIVFFSTSKATNLTEIGRYAFYNCANLCSYDGILRLPESIQIINDNAFDGCGHIKNVTLPSSLKKIGNRCLATGKPSTTITINKNLSIPPPFILEGIESKLSLPFGDIVSKPNDIPAISIHDSLINKYLYNDYWKIYARKMSFFSDDEDNTTPDDNPTIPDVKEMTIYYNTSNACPDGVTCTVSANGITACMINKDSPVNASIGYTTHTDTSVKIRVLLKNDSSGLKRAVVSWTNGTSTSASPTNITFEASPGQTEEGSLTISRASETIEAGCALFFNIS